MWFIGLDLDKIKGLNIDLSSDISNFLAIGMCVQHFCVCLFTLKLNFIILIAFLFYTLKQLKTQHPIALRILIIMI